MALAGEVAALAASGDGHVAVSVDGPSGPQLVILAPGMAGLTTSAIYPLPVRGTTIAWGNLGGGADVVVGAGSHLALVYNALGATRKPKRSRFRSGRRRSR